MTKSKKLATLLLTLALSIATVFTGVISVSADSVSTKKIKKFYETLPDGIVGVQTQTEGQCDAVLEGGTYLEEFAKTSRGTTTVKISAEFFADEQDYITLNFDNVFNNPEREDLSVSVLSFYLRAYDFKFTTADGEEIPIAEIEVEYDNASGEEEGFYKVKNNAEFIYSAETTFINYDDVVPQWYNIKLNEDLGFDENGGELGPGEGIDYVGEGYFTFTVEASAVIEEEVDTSTLGGWLESTGNDVSNWLSDNLGVSIGGTMSLILIVAILVVLLRKKRR